MTQLGIIPSWQFSADPSDNPMLNPTVDVPSGMYQAGVYYTQPAWGQPDTMRQMEDFTCLGCGPRSLGLPSIERGRPPVGVPYGFASGRPLPPMREMSGALHGGRLGYTGMPMPTYQPIGVPYGLKSGRPLPPLREMNGLGYVMVDEGPLGQALGMFDSWAWDNRKAIAISALGIVGAAALFIASSVLR